MSNECETWGAVSVTVICKSLFEVEAALDKLCAVLHHDKAFQSEANMILVTFRHRRLALEELQRQSQNAPDQPRLAGSDTTMQLNEL